MKCNHCGQTIPERHANRVTVYGMFEMQLFCPFEGATVDEIIAAWREQNSKPYPAMVGGRKVDDLGFATLCPATVSHVDADGKVHELRRVGKMVFPDWHTKQADESKIAEYREALLADPDISRLLKEQGKEIQSPLPPG